MRPSNERPERRMQNAYHLIFSVVTGLGPGS
jgi:hypothetical protein